MDEDYHKTLILFVVVVTCFSCLSLNWFQANVIRHLSLEAGDEKDGLQRQLEEKVTFLSFTNFLASFIKRSSLIDFFGCRSPPSRMWPKPATENAPNKLFV
jgi:hypothetical protein